jgi:thioesterase DpgC
MVTRQGKASVVEMRNRASSTRWTTARSTRSKTASISPSRPATEIAVLRGGVVDHPNTPAAAVLLRHQPHPSLPGKISFLFYFKHAMGYEHKMFAGLARRDASIEDTAAATDREGLDRRGRCHSPSAAAASISGDGLRAGGQRRLHDLAGAEGRHHPGASNLRLPRFVGDRIARQAIMYGRRLDCDSPEAADLRRGGAAGEMDKALAGVIDGLTSSGVVSAVSNRRGFRIGQEPLDLFRRYLALYAREQAFCHFSPALIANLERHWNAMQRKA